MNFFANIFKRITEFDPKKVTPTQIVIGIIVFIVALALINFVLSLAQALLPVAVLALLVYLGYQWLSSRDPQEDKVVKPGRVQQEATEDDSQAQTTLGEALEARQKTEADEAARRLRVEQVANPDTGFMEADLARLEAEEQARLAQKEADERAIQEQLEERRRRLLKGDEDAS